MVILGVDLIRSPALPDNGPSSRQNEVLPLALEGSAD